MNDALESKTCFTCKKFLPLDNFYWNKADSRYYSECKPCSNKRSKKWKIDNKEKSVLNTVGFSAELIHSCSIRYNGKTFFELAISTQQQIMQTWNKAIQQTAGRNRTPGL